METNNQNQQPEFATYQNIIDEFRKYFSLNDAHKVAEKFIKFKGKVQLKQYIEERVKKWAEKELLFKRIDCNNSKQILTSPAPQPQFIDFSSIQREAYSQQPQEDEWFKFIASNSKSDAEWLNWMKN